MTRKNQLTSFSLTAFFGPIGLLYSTVWQAVVLFFLLPVVWMIGVGMGTSDGATTLVVTLGCWVLSPLLGASAVTAHNKRVEAQELLEERRHREMLAAVSNASRERVPERGRGRSRRLEPEAFEPGDRI